MTFSLIYYILYHRTYFCLLSHDIVILIINFNLMFLLAVLNIKFVTSLVVGSVGCCGSVRGKGIKVFPIVRSYLTYLHFIVFWGRKWLLSCHWCICRMVN